MARADLASRDLTLGGIRRALFQLLARFPVYRTYAGACGRSVQDREVFRYAAEAAREDLDEADRAVLDHLERWLGGQPLRELPPGPLRRLRGELLARFQQLSSPTAAKAVEDTACYRSAALLSRNDVGFDPQRFAASAEEFHAACEARRLASPRALLATASMTTSAARTPAPVLRRSVNWRPGSRVTSSTGRAWPRRCAATSPRGRRRVPATS